jgi:predicted transcriptional regulator
MGKRRVPTGPALLAAELERRGVSRGDLAQELDVSRGVVSVWIRGEGCPGLANAAAIRDWSEGRIALEAWL